MTDDYEPRVRELSPAEIEALRREMRESIECAKAELAHRRVVKWGMINGKLSDIRWVLGDEWDMLDT